MSIYYLDNFDVNLVCEKNHILLAHVIRPRIDIDTEEVAFSGGSDWDFCSKCEAEDQENCFRSEESVKAGQRLALEKIIEMYNEGLIQYKVVREEL